MSTPTGVRRIHPQPRTMPPVVAVGGGKGGVGTSTVAALLASVATADGYRTLLIDAGDRIGALHHLLGIEPPHSLADMRGLRRPADLIVPVTERMSLVSAAPSADVSAGERRVLMRRLVDLYPDFDLVVIDAGSSAESLTGACRIGAIRLLAVTASDRISLVATYALIKLLHERAPDVRVDVVANRVDEAEGERLHEYLNAASVRFLSRTVPYAGTVPEDGDFGRVLAAGMGTDEAALGSSAAHAMRGIAELLLGVPTPAPSTSYLSLLRKDRIV